MDYIVYEFTSYDVLHLAQNITHKGNMFYISKVSYKIVNNIIECLYSAQLKNGLLQRRLYNHRIIGVSILGNVLIPERDKIKVHLHIDKEQDLPTAYFFPYSTISASADGSGWYNMPEIKDEVRVYFPTRDGADAFSISSSSAYIPKSVSENDRMSNPNVEYIRTIEYKEVRFTENGIFISSDKTQAKINLLKNGDVIIHGQRNIFMTATEKLSFEAKKEILILAKESIKFDCEKGAA